LPGVSAVGQRMVVGGESDEPRMAAVPALARLARGLGLLGPETIRTGCRLDLFRVALAGRDRCRHPEDSQSPDPERRELCPYGLRSHGSSGSTGPACAHRLYDRRRLAT